MTNKVTVTLDGKNTFEIELTPEQVRLIQQGTVGGMSIEPKAKPAHRPNGPYYPTGLLGGEYCVFDRQPWPCPTAKSFPDLQEPKPE